MIGTLEDRQRELEQTSADEGIDRYFNDLNAADIGDTTAGRSLMLRDTSCYPSLVEKFAGVIQAMCTAVEEGKAGSGRPALAYSYLKMLDPVAVAYITVRCVLHSAVKQDKLTATCMRVARGIEDQYRNDQLMEMEPNLGYSAAYKAERRPNAHVRRTILRGAADLANVRGMDWSEGDKLKLGNKLIEMFINNWRVKSVEGEPLWVNVRLDKMGTKRVVYVLNCHPHMITWMESVNGAMSLLRPKYMPMIVKPLPWTDTRDGGYLTEALRVNLIRDMLHETQDDMMSAEMPAVLTAVNAAQNTPWKINTRILDLMDELHVTGESFGGTPSADPSELPERPDDIDRDLRVADMTDDQVARFRSWRNAASKVHASNARIGSKRLAFTTQRAMAKAFRDFDRFYFPHNLDFRGRLYSLVPELNPQADDLGKAMLMFADGKQLGSSGAFWLYVHVANLFGIDKCSFDDRVAWVEDHIGALIDSANNPLDGARMWCDADDPWQALAACFELAELATMLEPEDFISYLPIAMDGSCSGLQHFSAMLLDQVGAEAVNLTDNSKPSDIYTRVQAKTEELLLADHDNLALSWRSKVTRKIVKRPCMTFAYSVTQRGIRDQIREEMDKAASNYLPGWENHEAATFLAPIVEEAIKLTVTRAAEAMDWLKDTVRILIAAERPVIWSTPVGFIVHQRYRKSVGKHFKVWFQGKRVRLVLRIVGEKPDTRKQTSAVAPNFVHSMDAAHLQMVLNRMTSEGITTSFSVIHDSFGVHACDVDELHYAIRDEFINLYSTSQLEKYRNWVISTLPESARDQVPEVPDAGDFDIEEVRRADFFFA